MISSNTILKKLLDNTGNGFSCDLFNNLSDEELSHIANIYSIQYTNREELSALLYLQLKSLPTLPQEMKEHIYMQMDFMDLIRLEELPGVKRVLLKKYDPELHNAEKAIISGNLELLKWLHRNNIGNFQPNCKDIAAYRGKMDILIWLHENRSESFGEEVIDLSAAVGQLPSLIWLHKNTDKNWTTNAMDFAADYNHLHVVEWLHNNRTEGCTTQAIDAAAERGSLEIVAFLLHNRTEGFTIDAIDNAELNGHHEIATLLRKNIEKLREYRR